MQKKVKLSAKQLKALQDIELEKNILSDSYKKAVDKGALVIELVMELNDITEKPSNVKIDGENLVFEFGKEGKEEPEQALVVED